MVITLSSEGQEEIQRIADVLELLVQDNERWIHRMLEIGITPPCCSKCGGVRYRAPSVEDYEAGALLFKGAADMFKDHIAACGPIAAYDAAAMRVLEGIPATVVVTDSGGGEQSSYHAIVGTPTGLHDPTLEMEAG